MKPRKKPTQRMRALLQKEIESQCPFCLSKEVDTFEVHHIDENHKNNELNNLIILCPICHKKLTLHLTTLEELKLIQKENSYES